MARRRDSKGPEAPRLGRDGTRARRHRGPKRRDGHTKQPGAPSSPARRSRQLTARNAGTANSKGPEAPQRFGPHALACVSRSQVELNVAAGDGLDQLARVVLNRVVEQLVRRVGLDELALLHDDDVVGDLADDRQVVRDEQV